MNNSLRKTYNLQYLWILVMLSLTFPLSMHWPIFERHYIFIAIGILLTILFAKRFFKQIVFNWTVIFLIIVYLNYIAGDSYFTDLNMVLFQESVNFIIPLSLTFYLFTKHDYGLFKLLIIVFGLFLIECAVISYWANSLLPGIIRLQSNAVSIQQNANILAPYVNIGMTDYAIPHAIPIIIPGLYYAFINSVNNYKVFFIIIIIASIILSYSSESFTALFFTIFSLIISIISVNKNNSKKTITRILIVSLLFLPIASSKDLQLSSVKFVQSFFPEESLAYKKFSDITTSLTYNEADGSVSSRAITYEKTFDAIINNVIIGSDQDSGGHSAIFDRLAAIGLVGMIPWLMIIIYQIKFTLKYLRGPIRYYYYIGIFLALLMMLLKNMSNWTMWFFVITILPCLLWWIENSFNLNVKNQ